MKPPLFYVLGILGIAALLGGARAPRQERKPAAPPRATTPPKKVAPPNGVRIYLIGDSLSVPFGKTPGQLLAQNLEALGYEVRVNAIGGRSATSFVQGSTYDSSHKIKESAPGLEQLARVLDEFDPQVVIVLLGTNDVSNVSVGASEKSQLSAFSKILQFLEGEGVQVIGIGPPSFPPEDQPHEFKQGKDKKTGQRKPSLYGNVIQASNTFVPKLEALYGNANFIDSRPLTKDLANKANRSDGIHFTTLKGAQKWANRLADKLQAGMLPASQPVAGIHEETNDELPTTNPF